MSVINMAKNIKTVHPEFLICYKVGSFYNCYGKDAYILSFLFNYKLKTVENNILETGFPKNAISKIMARLEREKINYLIIDTRNNYDIDEKEDFDNLNRYNEVFNNSKKAINLRVRVDKIAQTILKKQDAEIIRKIEELIYEDRKI